MAVRRPGAWRASASTSIAVHWPILRRIAGTLDGSGPRVYNLGRQALAPTRTAPTSRAWLPPLMDVPSSFVHNPWLMPAAMQAAARCRVGVDIPSPLSTPRAAALRRPAARPTTKRRGPGRGSRLGG
ncbi:MAG: hypothetical protein U0470_00535 [Anaerolineae bacterium]